MHRLIWVLEIELGSCIKIIHVHKHWASSLALPATLNKKSLLNNVFKKDHIIVYMAHQVKIPVNKHSSLSSSTLTHMVKREKLIVVLWPPHKHDGICAPVYTNMKRIGMSKVRVRRKGQVGGGRVWGGKGGLCWTIEGKMGYMDLGLLTVRRIWLLNYKGSLKHLVLN